MPRIELVSYVRSNNISSLLVFCRKSFVNKQTTFNYLLKLKKYELLYKLVIQLNYRNDYVDIIEYLIKEKNLEQLRIFCQRIIILTKNVIPLWNLIQDIKSFYLYKFDKSTYDNIMYTIINNNLKELYLFFVKFFSYDFYFVEKYILENNLEKIKFICDIKDVIIYNYSQLINISKIAIKHNNLEIILILRKKIFDEPCVIKYGSNELINYFIENELFDKNNDDILKNAFFKKDINLINILILKKYKFSKTLPDSFFKNFDKETFDLLLNYGYRPNEKDILHLINDYEYVKSIIPISKLNYPFSYFNQLKIYECKNTNIIRDMVDLGFLALI